MNDRLAEGLRKQTSMTNYCGEGELSERIFCGYFEEIFKKEERTGIEIKQKILEFRPSVVRHAVCCNPGALGHSALSSCVAAVYFNNSPAFAGISCSSTPPNTWQHQDSLPGWAGGEDYQRAMNLFSLHYKKLKSDSIKKGTNLSPGALYDLAMNNVHTMINNPLCGFSQDMKDTAAKFLDYKPSQKLEVASRVDNLAYQDAMNQFSQKYYDQWTLNNALNNKTDAVALYNESVKQTWSAILGPSMGYATDTTDSTIKNFLGQKIVDNELNSILSKFDVNGDIIAQINNLTPDMKQAVLEYSFKKRQQSGEAEGEEWSKLSYYGDSQANLKARDLKQMAFLNKFYGSIFPNKEGLTGANEMLKMSLTLTGALEMDGYTDDLGVYDLLSMNTARKISRMLNGGSEKDLVSCYENSGINFSNGKFEGEAGFLETEAYKVVKSTDPAVKQNWEASWANVKYANEVDLGSKGHDKRGSEILAEFIPQLEAIDKLKTLNPNEPKHQTDWVAKRNEMYRRIVASDLKLISDVKAATDKGYINVNSDPLTNPNYRSNTPKDQKFAMWYGNQLQSIFKDATGSFLSTGEYKFFKDEDIHKKIEAYRNMQ